MNNDTLEAVFPGMTYSNMERYADKPPTPTTPSEPSELTVKPSMNYGRMAEDFETILVENELDINGIESTGMRYESLPEGQKEIRVATLPEKKLTAEMLDHLDHEGETDVVVDHLAERLSLAGITEPKDIALFDEYVDLYKQNEHDPRYQIWGKRMLIWAHKHIKPKSK